MNRLSMILTLAVLLMVATLADAKPVLVVVGNLKDESSQPVKEKFTVRVKNETRNLEAKSEADASGAYKVTLVALPPEKTTAAEAGDKLNLSALNAKGEISASRTYQLQPADLSAAVVALDLIIPSNQPPRFTKVGDKAADATTRLLFEAQEGNELRLPLVAEDPNGDSMTYDAEPKPLPEDARFESNVFIWTPGYDTVTRIQGKKDFDLTFTVSDGKAKASQPIRIQVSHTNRSPDFLPTEKLFAVREGETLQMTVTAEDPDGDPLTYSVSPLPKDAQLMGNAFTWTPGYDTVSRTEGKKSFDLTLTVSDGKDKTSQPIQIQVSHTERPPRLTQIGNQPANPSSQLTYTVREGETLQMTVTAEDPDGDPLTYSASPLPTGTKIEGNVLTWTPGYDTVTCIEGLKDFNLTLTASDGVAKASQPVRIQVSYMSNADKVTFDVEKAELPAISGSTLKMTVTVQDVQGQPVTDECVTLQLSPQVGSLSEVKNHGDGTYTATYTAGADLGEVNIIASTTNDKQGRVTLTLVTGPPAALQLTCEPSELVAGSGKTATVTVRVTDAADHPTDAPVKLSFSPQIGKLSPLSVPSPGGVGVGGKGIYTATYTAGETSGDVKINATVDQTPLIQGSCQITLVEPELSVAVTSPVTAGETATITVTLLSSSGKPIPDRDVRISVERENQPVASLETVPTNAAGQTQAMFRPTVAGSYTIHVSVPDGPESEVTLVVNPASPDKIELDAPATVERGKSLTLTVRVFDRFGNPISSATVLMRTERGTVTSPATPVPNEAGVYTATFRDETAIKAGEKVKANITASISGGPSLLKSVTVVDTIALIDTGKINPLQGKAGDTFTLTAQAEPGGAMTFTIGDVVQEHPMQEVSTGRYEGNYRVPTGIPIEAVQVPVTLRLKDAAGNLGELTLKERVTIDTVPPPAPKELRVEGGGITRENLKNVVVMALATPGRQVDVMVTASNGDEVGNVSSVADGKGQVTWHLDATAWPDGKYLFKAVEAPDEVGNAGEATRLFVTKDTRDVTVVLFASPSAVEVPYDTTASLEVVIKFLKPPAPESVEVAITLHPPIGDKRIHPLKLRSKVPGTLPFKADVLGVWEYEVTWSGNADHRAPDPEKGSFEVVSSEGKLALEVAPRFIKLGQKIQFSGQLMTPPNLANQKIRIQAIRPDGVLVQLPGEALTSPTGHFQDVTFTPDKTGPWQFQAVWGGLQDAAGNVLYQRTESSPSVEVTVQYPFGKAVIAVGGDASPHWKGTFFRLGQYVYDTFRRRGFPEETIRFLSPTPTAPPTDTRISKAALKDAILNWGPTGLQSNESLHIYLLSDNLKDAGFILNRDETQTERLERSDVHQWLEELNRRKVNVVLIMESCYSGEYIQASTTNVQARRVLITSADARTQADIIRTDSFTRRFFNRLQRREDFKSAFEETTKEMNFSGFRNRPQVDADGDGVPNQREDLAALDDVFLNDPKLFFGGDEPDINDWSPPQILAKGVHEATIEAFIQGGGVTASAVIFPPGRREVSVLFDSWEALESEAETLPLVGTENTGYRGLYTGFTTPGTYTILIYAENIDGIATPALTTVTVPLPDVNSDGVVNVFDLVSVGLQFGQSGANLSGDVNGDGTVNVLDLVLVGQHFGETSAAPGQQASALTPEQRQVLAQVQAILQADGRPEARRLAAWLEGWLTPLPSHTQLLPVYPNPANPEVWIPYTLAVPSDVVIRIFDIQGRLVRTLSLGHQAAGEYIRPTHAAHWDGRNATGERVASGVYFIQWQVERSEIPLRGAGGETTIRQMMLRK